MKRKVAFVGFWDTFDFEQNLIYNILSKHYDVEICDANDAEYSICTLYTKEYINASGVRIFYSAEAVAPDFTLFDYFIGFDEMKFGDRYCRLPNYLMNMKYKEDIQLMLNRHAKVEKKRDKFCSWVCSNGNGDSNRDYIYDKLSEYKTVDSAGTYRNNIGSNNRIPDKRAFQEHYKFSLAVENTSYKGYTTEKLVEAFAAGGIPIYWGDPDVNKYFNTKAFVNLMDYPSIEDGIEAIINLDQNDELYYSMLSQNALANENYIEESTKNLEEFLIKIFNQPLTEAYRRPRGQTATHIENIVRRGLFGEACKSEPKAKSILRRIKDIL